MGRSITTHELNTGAVQAFLVLEGGWDAYKARGGQLLDLIPLLEASPDEELSGLREIAERQGYTSSGYVNDFGEPLIEPDVARLWLLGAGLAAEEEEGLALVDAEPDHIAVSGLAIALGTDSRYLYDVYSGLPEHQVQLSRQVVADKAKLIVNTYSSKPDK